VVGFRYLTPENRRLLAAQELKRIAASQSRAYRRLDFRQGARHLQRPADARGPQTISLPSRWRQVRDSAKFDRMVAFGEACPNYGATQADLGLPGCRAKRSWGGGHILYATRVRIGNTEYARDQQKLRSHDARQPHVSFIRDGAPVLNFSAAKRSSNMKFTAATSALRRS